MSTRSMTLVQQLYSGDKDAFIPLYRHCDGYPAEAGAAIVEALKGNPKTCEEIVKRLLAGDIGEYRLATWQPEEQGDLEHVYIIARKDGAWVVTHHAVMPGSWDNPGREDYRSNSWAQSTYTLAEFREVVNKDRREMNARLAQLRASSKHYADAADYPMI